MIFTSHKQKEPTREMIQFLQTKIGLSESDIKLGLRQCESQQTPLPIVLWSFGLLSLDQYQKVLDWERDHS